MSKKDKIVVQSADESRSDSEGLSNEQVVSVENSAEAITFNAEEYQINVIAHSGLFNETYYLETNPDLHQVNNLLIHFFYNGFREGRKPCYLFDPLWYLECNADVRETSLNPLYHYIVHGEAEGRNPSILFNVKYYESQVTGQVEGQTLLSHFLNAGSRVGYDPTFAFKAAEYLEQNVDVREAGVDPYYHFLSVGVFEGRLPFRGLSFEKLKAFFADKKIISNFELYLCYLARETSDLQVFRALSIKKEESTLSDQEYLMAGPLYEDPKYDLSDVDLEHKAIAYYLPQFYPFEENNEWWGEGFTEWRNVARGRPRYRGHYQPHIPRDLGFYDLRNVESIKSQIEMAKKAGLFGFCFYYYWFNKKRLLDVPVDLFLQNTALDMPFCLMWANENWTRTWDGFESDVLIRQDYNLEDDADFVDDLARHFLDDRYIRIGGRPLYFIYRPGIIPDAKERIQSWRYQLKQKYGLDPIVFMAQGFGDIDPGKYGLDGAVEFPPHKVAQDLPLLNSDLLDKDPDFGGIYFKYADMVSKSVSEVPPSFDLIKCVTPHWDNEARKPNKGMGFVGSSPAEFKKWLDYCLRFSKLNPINRESFVFVNAWNEWAEGAHLEPDVYYGSAYLNALSEALLGKRDRAGSMKILYVGHDAHKHGAQLLSLNIVKQLKRFGVEVEVLLLEGGELVGDFRKIANTHVINSSQQAFRDVLKHLNGYELAITNTAVTGRYCKLLYENGYRIVSLVHELSNLIKEFGLEGAVKDIVRFSEKIVFASTPVRESFKCVAGENSDKYEILPQGIYQDLIYVEDARRKLRDRLRLGDDVKIIVNAGFGDLRKGFDIFVSLAKLAVKKSNLHFVWLGDVHVDLKRWLASEVNSLNNLTVEGFTNEVSLYLQGADLFALTSREDPFPSVMLEGVASGLPIVAFQDSGGCTDLLKDPSLGCLVDYANPEDFLLAIETLLSTETQDKREARVQVAKEHFNWKHYVFQLMTLLKPELKKVSVVVPNYNYEQCIVERLQSVAEQTYPIYEVIVLDDCSTDGSVAVIENFMMHCEREMRFESNDENSGSVFKQWSKGVGMAVGDYVWMAEADDLAEVNLLEEIFRCDGDFDLALTDSKQIDFKGQLLADSYHYYYDDHMKTAFSIGGIQSGKRFLSECLAVKNQIMNASAVVFDRSKAASVFCDSIDEVVSYKVAGDWLFYFKMLSPEDSKVFLVDKALNIHRRHDSSVTKLNYGDKQLSEIESVQNAVFSLDPSDSLRASQQSYLEEIRRLFCE